MVELVPGLLVYGVWVVEDWSASPAAVCVGVVLPDPVQGDGVTLQRKPSESGGRSVAVAPVRELVTAPLAAGLRCCSCLLCRVPLAQSSRRSSVQNRSFGGVPW